MTSKHTAAAHPAGAGPLHAQILENDMKNHRKRHGTQAKRTRNAPATSRLEAMHAPVDPLRFLEMTRVFNEGALVPLRPHAGAGWSLTDIPINRAMTAVCGVCEESNLPDGETEAVMTRLMLMGQVIQARHLFAKYIRSSPDGRSTDLAGALLKAVAVAQIKVHGEHAHLDLDDVLLHAQHFEALDSDPE